MMNPPAKTSGQAIASLIFGILSITCLWILGSIPAIILGIMAIRRVDQSGGTLKGRGLGIAGIATGGAGVILGLTPVAIIASMVVPVYTKVGERAEVSLHNAQMRQVLLACQSYASEHDGNHPPSLGELTKEGYLDDETLLSLKTTAERRSGTTGSALLYRRGLTDTASPNEVLIAAPMASGSRRLVGRVNGRVDEMPESEFQVQYAHLFH